MMEQTSSSRLKYIKAKEGDRQKCNYNQRNYQNKYRSNSRDRRIQFSSRIQYGQNYRGRPRYEQNYRNDYRRGNFKGYGRMFQNQNFRKQNNRGGYRGNYRNKNYERGRSRSIERLFSGNIRGNNRSSSNSRSRSESRASTNRDRIRYYKCREYNHFAKDCLTTKEERQIEYSRCSN